MHTHRQVGSGSVSVLPTLSRDGQLPGVEQTEPGESGPLVVELQLSGVLSPWPAAGRMVSIIARFRHATCFPCTLSPCA